MPRKLVCSCIRLATLHRTTKSGPPTPTSSSRLVPTKNTATSQTRTPTTQGLVDAVGFTCCALVMYACCDDGVMLKPRWPLSSLDFTFTDPADSIGTLVWAAHDDYGPLRWSYTIGINLDRYVAITLERLQGLSSGPMVAWKVEVGVLVTSVIPFPDQQGPLDLPAGPVVPKGPSLSHWAAAPILPNGVALLGDDGKWTTMSGRRVASLKADSSTVTLALFGAPAKRLYLPMFQRRRRLCPK